MNRKKSLNRLVFNNYQPIDEQIQPVASIDLDFTVLDWNGHLTVDRVPCSSEFVREAVLVGGFEKPRPKGAVNSYCRIDHTCADLFNRPSDLALASFVFFAVQLGPRTSCTRTTRD